MSSSYPMKDEETDGLVEANDEPTPFFKSYRLFITICGSLLVCNTLACQTSMSSAMVCMLKDSDSVTNNKNMTNITGLDMTSQDPNGTDDQSWKVDWNSNTRGWVVSSFFAAYYSMQLPSGLIISRFGPRVTMVFSLVATGVLQLVSVPAIRYNLTLLYVIRAITGLTCGSIFPGAYALVANWAPKVETSLIFGITGTGLEFGNTFSFLVALIGCESGFQGGWPIVFYVLGASEILLGAVLFFFVTDFPKQNAYVSRQEANYITNYSVYGEKKRNERIPLWTILKSRPVWGFMIAQLGTEWVYYAMITQGPLYMMNIMMLESWQTNVILSVPFLLIIPVIYVIGRTSDWVIHRGFLSIGTVRKINDIYSKFFTGIAIVMLGFLPRTAWVSAFFAYILAAVGIAGAFMGYLANPGDLSPSHTGVVVALGQGSSNWVSFAIPIITGTLTSQNTRHSWQTIFYMTAGVLSFSLIGFLVCGSGELQHWAIADEEYQEITGEQDDVKSSTERNVPSKQIIHPGSISNHP